MVFGAAADLRAALLIDIGPPSPKFKYACFERLMQELFFNLPPPCERSLARNVAPPFRGKRRRSPWLVSFCASAAAAHLNGRREFPNGGTVFPELKLRVNRQTKIVRSRSRRTLQERGQPSYSFAIFRLKPAFRC